MMMTNSRSSRTKRKKSGFRNWKPRKGVGVTQLLKRLNYLQKVAFSPGGIKVAQTAPVDATPPAAVLRKISLTEELADKEAAHGLTPAGSLLCFSRI